MQELTNMNRDPHSCFFFYDPAVKGYYLENLDLFTHCIEHYRVPQELVESCVLRVNATLRRPDLEAAVPPETVFDQRVRQLLSLSISLIFLFFVITIAHLFYYDQYMWFFYLGCGALLMGLLGMLIVMLSNGDFRKERKSKIEMKMIQQDQVRQLTDVVLTEKNGELEEYGLYFMLNSNAMKLELLPIQTG